MLRGGVELKKSKIAGAQPKERRMGAKERTRKSQPALSNGGKVGVLRRKRDPGRESIILRGKSAGGAKKRKKPSLG